jgi:hypothetical protein
LIACDSRPPAAADLAALLKTMAVLTAKPLDEFSPTFRWLNQVSGPRYRIVLGSFL